MWSTIKPTAWLAVLTCLPPLMLAGSSWPDQLAEANQRVDQGLYREAIVAYNIALGMVQAENERAETFYRLAVAHRKTGDFDAAGKYYRDALALFRALGPSSGYALALAGLGEIHRMQSRFNEALNLERQSLGVLKRMGLEKSSEAAAVLNIMGSILFQERQYKAAGRDLTEALVILEKTSGPGHPDIAMSLHNLAAVALAQQNTAEAEDLLLRALRIRQARFGPAHPLIASTLLSLSSAYDVEKRYADADRVCREAMVMMNGFLPAGHPDMINAARELALITHDSGDHSAALKVLEDERQAVKDAGRPLNTEYLQLLDLYGAYLDSSGQKEKSFAIRSEMREAARALNRPSQTNSTVSIGELALGSLGR